MVISSKVLEERSADRALDVEASEFVASQAVEMFVKFNEDLRISVRDHMGDLVEDAKESLSDLRNAWQLREDYKAFVDAKNNSLTWILNKASQAIETTNVEPTDSKDAKTGKPGSKTAKDVKAGKKK